MPKQFYIIDGYNFLHAAGMIPRHVGPVTLMRSRRHLLHFLETRLTKQERINTTIVFDVHQLKDEIVPEEFFAEMTIINAVNYPDADTCIEELILKHSAPKQLTVISADHRLHRAAQTRKATPIDSEDFFEHLESRDSNSEISETEKIKRPETFHYPEEDLPEDVRSPVDSPSGNEDLELWQKRIDELGQE